MKTTTTILFMAFAILVTSCSKSDDSETLEPVTKPFFVKINGVDFEPLQILTQVSGNSLNFGGENAQGIDMFIGLSTDVEAGTVLNANFTSNATDLFVPIYDTDNGGFFATSGTLTIVSHDKTDKKMTGRFNFSAPDPDDASQTLNFTDGEFIVSYGAL